ncbi:MAG: hypothetical protein U0793_21425 [Gemmataceae bacterium]
MYIAPVIFALALVLNTVISLFWHPNGRLHEAFPWSKDDAGLEVLCRHPADRGGEATLVLFSKEEAEELAKKERARPSDRQARRAGAGGAPPPSVENWRLDWAAA